MEKRKSVVLKGCAGGVNMILNPDVSLSEILEEMRDIIKSCGGFFKGECKVFVSGRELSRADKLRVSSVMSTIFPEAELEFKSENPIPAPEIISKNHTDKGAKFLEELSKAAQISKSYLKTSHSIRPNRPDARVYSGNLKSGDVLNCTGDILVVGSVEKGATVSADGDVYIMGKISGNVQTSNGTIKAVYFDGGTVKIGDVSKDGITGGAKEVYTDENGINSRDF